MLRLLSLLSSGNFGVKMSYATTASLSLITWFSFTQPSAEAFTRTSWEVSCRSPGGTLRVELSLLKALVNVFHWSSGESSNSHLPHALRSYTGRRPSTTGSHGIFLKSWHTCSEGQNFYLVPVIWVWATADWSPLFSSELFMMRFYCTKRTQEKKKTQDTVPVSKDLMGFNWNHCHYTMETEFGSAKACGVCHQYCPEAWFLSRVSVQLGYNAALACDKEQTLPVLQASCGL